MNRVHDMMLTTQFCTIVAFAIIYVAHLIEAGHILNPNWGWTVWWLAGISVFFMLAPWIFTRDIDLSQVVDTPFEPSKKSCSCASFGEHARIECEELGCCEHGTGIYGKHTQVINQKPVRPY